MSLSFLPSPSVLPSLSHLQLNYIPFSLFPLCNTCVLLSPLSLPPPPFPLPEYSYSLSGLLASAVSPGFILKSKDSELGSTDRREHSICLSESGVSHSAYYFQFHLFNWKCHDFSIFYDWIEFCCAYTPHFHYLFNCFFFSLIQKFVPFLFVHMQSCLWVLCDAM